MRQRVQRFEAELDEHAKREERRSADAALAMDQDAPAAAEMFLRKLYPPLEHDVVGRLLVRRRKMQEIDSSGPQQGLVVAVFLAKVDDGADAVVPGEQRGMLDRKACADGEILRQPMQIRTP